MEEAGLIQLKPVITRSKDVHLTWSGHEFLDLARKDTTWKKAKNLAKEMPGGLSIDALKTAVPIIAGQALHGL